MSQRKRQHTCAANFYNTLLVITWETSDSDQMCWRSCRCQKVDHGWLSQLWTPSH